MNAPFRAEARAEADARSKQAWRQFLPGLAARALLVAAGLAVGTVLGWIAGVALGLIQFSC